MGKEEEEPTFEELLEKFDKQERESSKINIVRKIGKLGDKKAIDSLIQLFQDKNEYIRRASLEAVVQLGGIDVLKQLSKSGVLFGLLYDNDYIIREKTIEFLRNLENKDAIEPLLGLLEDRTIYRHPTEISAVIEALGKLGDIDIIQLILLGKSKFVKDDIEEYLSYDNIPLHSFPREAYSIAKKLLENLSLLDEIKEWKKYFLVSLEEEYPSEQIISKSFDFSLKRLLQLIADKPEYLFDSERDLEELHNLRKDQKQQLINLLTSKEINLRTSAVIALGHIGYKKSTNHLVRVIENDRFKVRKHAIWVLGKIRDKNAIEPLLKVIENDRLEARILAFSSLIKIDYKKTIAQIIDSLRDEVKLLIKLLQKIKYSSLSGNILFKSFQEKQIRRAIMSLEESSERLHDKYTRKAVLEALENLKAGVKAGGHLLD